MSSSRLLRLRWAVARARAMSIPEWGWRASTAVRARASALVDPFRQDPKVSRIAGVTAGDRILFGRSPLGFLPGEDPGRQELAAILAGFEANGAAQLEGARPNAHAEDDRIRILSPDWNRDPETGIRHPLVHWSQVDYRRPEIEAGIRRLWYAARHLDAPELALEYYVTGDERAASAALAPIVSWITQCPPGRGIHWSVPLELGLRLVSWSWTLRLLEGSPALEKAATAIARSVHAQAEHVLAYRSRFSSANNHLIAQAAGLVHAGFAMSGLRGSARWRRVGGELLWSEILRQTTPDGVSREASLHYQEFVLELVLLSWLVLRANGTEPPPAARERIAAMLDFVADLDAFPGGAPEFGDSDGQTVLPFKGAVGPRPVLLALGAVLCERPSWKAGMDELPRPAAILLGLNGRQAFAELAPGKVVQASRWYRAAGLGLFRDASGDRALLFDGAPLGYLATAAHGHADCLSIALGAFGQALLIDPGTYTYHAEPALRNHFRSTAAHNTLRIDGEEQSEMRGAFLWGRRAVPRVEAVATEAAWDLVTASHDGFQRLRAPVTHRRTVVFVKPDYYWVLDDLAGRGRHLVESFWHLAPGATVTRHAAGVQVHVGKVELAILWAGDRFGELELWEGSERPVQGWASPEFGARVPAPVLRCLADRELPVRAATLLRPRVVTVGAATTPVTAGSADLGPGDGFWARGMPGQDLLLRHDARGTIDVGGTSLDVALQGRAALVRWQGEQIVTLAGHGLEQLQVNGEVLVQVESGSVDFSLRRVGEQAVVEGSGGRLALRIPGLRAVRGASSQTEPDPGTLRLTLGTASPS